MSSRRGAMSMAPAPFERPPKKRNRCTSFLCMSWKVFTCIFSHVTLVTLVVAYCIFGAKTFEYLEANNERQVSVPSILFLYCNFVGDFCIVYFVSKKVWALEREQTVFMMHLK